MRRRSRGASQRCAERPTPASVIASGALQSVSGAEGQLVAARGTFFQATAGYFNGLFLMSGLLSDESYWSTVDGDPTMDQH